MKFIALLFALTLSGCAGLSVEERFDLASECQAVAGADCQKLWDDWNLGVEAQARRDAANEPPCPQGYVLYCDRWCTKSAIGRGSHGICVKSSSISWY